MKKSGLQLFRILCMLLTACLSAACHHDTPSISEPEGDPIRFGGQATGDREATRATGLETQNITAFKVYGYKNTTLLLPHTTDNQSSDTLYKDYQTVFGGYKVQYVPASTSMVNQYGWDYLDTEGQYVKFWDYDAKAYRFAAFAPADAAVTFTDNIASAGTMTFRFDASCVDETSMKATPYFTEVWRSNNAMGYPAYGQGVILSFVQPFCRVRIMLVDEAGKSIAAGSELAQAIDGTSIRLTPVVTSGNHGKFRAKGTVTVGYDVNNKPLTREHITVEPDAATTDVVEAITQPWEETVLFANEAKKWYTFLVRNSGDAEAQADVVDLQMSLTVNNETRTARVPKVYAQWRPGYAYTYTFRVDRGNVTFEPRLSVFTKWQAGYSSETSW